MKKTLLVVAMSLFSFHAAFSDPSSVYKLNETINIKNNSSNTIDYTCGVDDQSQQVAVQKGHIDPGKIFSYNTGWLGGEDGCTNMNWGYPVSTACVFSDPETEQSGSFVAHPCETKDSGSTVCNNTLDLPTYNPLLSPATYACSTSSCSYQVVQPTTKGCTGDRYNCTVAMDVAVGSDLTYEVKWNDVKMNLAKGQVVADKLAATLMSSGSFNKPAQASYDGSTLLIKLFVSGNPFINDTTFPACSNSIGVPA